MPGRTFSAARLACIGADGQLPKLDLAYLLRYYAEFHVGIPVTLQARLACRGSPSAVRADSGCLLWTWPFPVCDLQRPSCSFVLLHLYPEGHILQPAAHPSCDSQTALRTLDLFDPCSL